jgi:O-antigen/teichoic acid export membrane protein
LGIIQKQALRTTVVSYLGIIVGMVSQLLFVVYLTKTEIGVLALLNSASNIIGAIFCLGFAQITFQIFSSFRDEKNGHSGFFVFALVFSIVGIVLGELTFYFLEDLFIGVGDEYKLVQSLSYLVFPIIFFRIFFRNFDVYLRMLFSSVTGVFLEGIVLRLTIFIGVILFWLNWINFEGLAIVYALALSIPGFVIIILAFFKTNKILLPKRELFTREARKKILNYGTFGIIASISGVLILSIDQIMLNQMEGTDAVGLYSVMFFAGALISIPSRGIKRIAVPVLTESWKNKDVKNINKIYEKSVVNQSVVGLFLFVIGWALAGPVLTFVPKFSDGLYVFFFIGLGQLFDMLTGLNMEIIMTSKHYRMNTYFNIALGVLVVSLNYFFILEWGVLGAAVASALAMLIINFIRWNYLRTKFELQPFGTPLFLILLIGTTLILVTSFIPLPVEPIWQIIIYGLGTTLIYWGAVLRLNLAPDISDWLIKIKKKFLA